MSPNTLLFDYFLSWQKEKKKENTPGNKIASVADL